MIILVAYDSYFGNTEKVAQRIADTLKADIVHVNDIGKETLKTHDLFILGSPTRAFKASDATRAFLSKLREGDLDGVYVAAFDTRLDINKVGNPFLSIMVRLFGYAAEPMAEKLVKNGGVQAAEPAWFYVEDSEGPLREGELERALDWAKSIQSELI
jgi:flavodoxin